MASNSRPASPTGKSSGSGTRRIPKHGEAKVTRPPSGRRAYVPPSKPQGSRQARLIDDYKND